ncbi:hypothetical protein F4804DRAFT_339546, partial [Jackrogersella minutella]
DTPEPNVRDNADSDPDSDDGDQPARHEGMGGYKQMKRYGYAYWLPKMDWSTRLLDNDHAPNFFRAQPEFATRLKKRRQQVLHVDGGVRVTDMIEHWLHARPLSEAQEEIILEFATGFLMVAFRRDVWGHLKGQKKLTSESEVLLNGSVPLTLDQITFFHDAGRPDFTSSNTIFHKGDPNILLKFLFTNEEIIDRKGPKARKHWDTMGFRFLFRNTELLLLGTLSSARHRRWKEEFFCIVHATNPVLPVPDSTHFIQPKSSKIKDRFPAHAATWHTWNWPHGVAPLGRPVKGRDIIAATYAGNPRVNPTTFYKSPGKQPVLFNKSPPQLEYEVDFIGKSLDYVTRKMNQRLARAR